MADEAQQPTATGLPAHLIEWIESVAGGRLLSARRMAGGGRKQAWFVDLEVAGAEQRLFFRWDPTDLSATGDPWTVRREAAFYQALDGRGLPVAGFVGLHPTAQALLLTCLPGEARFSKMRDEADRVAVARDFIRHLAALHALDVRDMGLVEPGSSLTLPDYVREQLAEFDNIIATRGGRVDPVLQLALDWLRDNVPAAQGPIVVVQGDTGPGNFLYEDGKVTAIVDWELAHLGDPMDDVAWVQLRSLQDPFGDLDALFAEYAQVSGSPLDGDRIRYYRVLAEAKIMVMSHGVSVRSRTDGEGGGGDPGARLIFGQLHRRLCAETLADVMGVALPEPQPLPDLPETDDDALFATVLQQMRDVITPKIEDSLASQRIKGLARALKYLSESSRQRSHVDAMELREIDEALGTTHQDVSAARAALADAVAQHTINPALALRTLYRQVLRQNELLRSASGVLADRHYAPVKAR